MLAAALCLAAMPIAPAVAAPADDAAATVHKFFDAFDAGDIKTAAATHEPDAVIIDEVPPHLWRSFQGWAGDLMKDMQAGGLTDAKVTLGRTVRAQVDGDTAYVVTEATFLYKEHGKPVAEPAQVVATLKHEADGWKIAGWAWSGGLPHPAT